MPSLYSTPPNQDVSSTNSTSLYGGAGTPIPDSTGNLVVRGDLIVQSGNILTTATTGNIFPTNATTINFGNAATAINIGANTGTTTVNNDLTVDGDLTINGTFIAPGAEFGNITIAVATDNTITTTTGNLELTAAGGSAVKITSETAAPTTISRNTTSTNVSVRSLSLDVQSSGTPAVGFGNSLEWQVEAQPGNTERAGFIAVNLTDITPGNEDFSMYFGLMENGATFTTKMALDSAGNLDIDNDLTVGGNDIKSSSGTTAITLSGADVTVAGTVTATGADLGNITVAVADDNTITTTSGNLKVTAVAGSSVNIVSETTAPTSITRNTSSTTGNVRSLSLAVESAGTPTVGFGNELDWEVEAQPGNTERAGYIAVTSTDLTPGSEDFSMRFGLMQNGATYTTKMELDSAGNLDIDGDLTVNDAVVFAGATSGSVSIAAPAVAGSQSYTLPTALPAVTGYVLSGTTGGALSWVANPDTNTTYTIDASSTTGGANFNLVGSDSTTDTIKFAGSGATTVTQTSANEITISSTNTNTTYDFNATSTTGGVNLNLVGSDLTTDTVKIADGTGVTASYVSGTEVSIAIGQPVATTDAVTFASVAANGVNVGLTANTISGAPLALASTQVGGGSVTIAATDSSPGSGDGLLTLNTSVLSYTHTDGALVPGVTGTWSFNPDGTTSFPNYTFPYADGTANQVLTTDGAGNVTWALPGGGGSTFGNVSIGVDTDQTISTTSGNLILQTAAGVNAGTVTLTAGTNGNITVAPNGTGKLVVNTETDTNISDGNYILGNISATRNTSWIAPTSGLSTISSSNGISVASSTSYGAQFQAVYYSGDTTAGTNTSAGYVGRGATGTNSAPSAAANNQVLVTFNADGYATTGFAQNIATVNSGGGTTSINPGQIQLYAREAFADNGTTVTNAGVGFRVRGFPTGVSMSTANRVNYIDHSPNSATYRSDTFTFQQGTTTTSTANLRSNTWNIQNSGGTTTYAQFASAGHTIGNVDSPSVFIRTSGATAGIRPVSFQRNTQTVTATPSNNDGASFRFQTAGSSGTIYNLSEFAGFYGSTGDSGLQIGVANGDQTTSTMTQVIPFQTKLSETRIKGTSTPTATAGGNTLTDVAIFTPAQTTFKSDAVTLQNNAGVALTSAGVNYTRTYGEFAYTNAAGFAIAAQNTIYTMPLDTTLNNSGVTISGTGNININVSGWYKIIMSLQVTLTVSNQPGQVDFWLRKNGVDVTNSKTQVDLLKDQKAVIAMDWLVNSDGNDYWEIVYVGTTANYADIDFPTIAATTTPYVSPVAPALIVNVIPAGM